MLEDDHEDPIIFTFGWGESNALDPMSGLAPQSIWGGHLECLSLGETVRRFMRLDPFSFTSMRLLKSGKK